MDPFHGETPPAPIPTPASYIPTAGMMELPPPHGSVPGSAAERGGDIEQTGAVGTGLNDYSARPASFEWSGASVPAASVEQTALRSTLRTNSSELAEPGRLPGLDAASMQPVRGSNDAWKAK
jgi:hypothetical protein